MHYFILESILEKGSFICLLFATLFSWAETTFTGFVDILEPRSIFRSKSRMFVWIASLFLGITLITRWLISSHAPLSNLYESLVWLSWGILSFGLLSYRKETIHSSIVASFSSFALFIYGFANFSLPNSMQAPNLLVPALQSNWLLMHVSVMMLSYSYLFCGSFISLIFVAILYNKKKTIVSIPNYLSLQNVQKISFFKTLDQIGIRSIASGFCLLTLGILSGAVWANEAWGSYWSWDPKETWALITWLVFATYLHLRLFKKWDVFQSAIFAIFGLVNLWVCYFGLNWLGQGLHTYGLFLK